MIKPFLKIFESEDEVSSSIDNKEHISNCFIFWGDNILKFTICTRIPMGDYPSKDLMVEDKEDEIQLELISNGKIVTYTTIYDLENDEHVKNEFLEWLNAYRAVIQVEEFRANDYLSKMVRWFDNWKNEKLIKDVIE